MAYLIIKHTFNNMENTYPDESEIVGYVENEQDADKWIESNVKQLNIYKGWDGCTYPYYTKELVKKLHI